MPHLLFSSKDDLKRKFLENIHFDIGGSLADCGNRMIFCFNASIPQSSLYSIHPFLSNLPGGKYLVRQGTESIPSPKQQRRPLPSRLSLSFFMIQRFLTFREVLTHFSLYKLSILVPHCLEWLRFRVDSSYQKFNFF